MKKIRNKTKIGIVFCNVLLCLMFQMVSAHAWMETQVINDYGNDMVMFDEEFYEKYEIDTEDDPKGDLDTIYEAFSKHWYDDKATQLTEKKNEDYAYIDVLDISKELVSEKLVIKIRTRGNLDKEDYWTCCVWNSDMLLMFAKLGDDFILIDIDNDDELYEGKFYDTDDQFIVRFEDIDKEAWEGSDIKFMSIGMNSDNDVIVDINPNSVNLNLIYLVTGVVLTILILFAIAVYYKTK